MSPKKIIRTWIDDISDNKLEGGILKRGTIWEDRLSKNFRLHNQETIIREGEPVVYNIQVQVNNGCRISTFRKGKNVLRKTVAWLLAPAEGPWSAQKIRDELKASIAGEVLMRPGNKQAFSLRSVSV